MAGGCIVSYPPAIWVPRGNNIFQSAGGPVSCLQKGASHFTAEHGGRNREAGASTTWIQMFSLADAGAHLMPPPCPQGGCIVSSFILSSMRQSHFLI